uniref:Uncharacterized protein n=1 Tax=Panagrolaimus superbus TaxID=310955 RepID=A0A914YFS6_9BILA
MSKPPSLREKLKNAPFCIRPSSPTFNYLNGIDPILLQMDREMEKVEAIDAARTAAMIKRRYAVTSYPCNPGQGHGYNKFITSNHEEVEWNEEIFQRLKEIGVLVFKNDKNEIYFYIGEMRFCTLLELVDERWNNTGCNNAGESAIFEPMKEIVMREITAELRKNFQRWKIFLEPIRSHRCVHDTFIRVLILSQTFQILIIKTLVGMLQKICEHKKMDI